MRANARWVCVVVLALAGCTGDVDDDPLFRGGPVEGNPPPVQKVPAPLPAAHCEITVDGVGVLSMEEEYLPRVIRCENGGANLEALKAQAIAARSVAYYAIETSGSICDSQGCQVYGCDGDPEAIHYQAVSETSGVYMMYSGTLTYGFYVAGDNGVAPPACVGDVSVGTEHWVTYNEGKSGTEVVQTELGFVFEPTDAGYGQNRGCMSQWGARCLENNNAYDVGAILRFYYGEDIELVQATGECVAGGFDTGMAGGSSGDAGGETLDPGDAGSEADSSPPESDGAPVDDGGPVDDGADGIDPSATGAAESDDAAEDPAIDGALPEGFGGTATTPGGCACTTSSPGALGGSFVLLAALGVRRRRQAARCGSSAGTASAVDSAAPASLARTIAQR